MTTWSVDDLREEIKKLVPKNWKLTLRVDQSGFFEVWLEDKEKIVWETFETDEKRALFEVYGYLWMKQRPLREVDSPWVRRRSMLSPPQASVSDSSPDPEDIDPREVESVYASIGNKS